MAQTELEVLDGGLAVDDRGAVAFTNSFSFQDVCRYYLISNHHRGFVRAWHAHKHEAKYVTVVQGAALIGAVRLDSMESPSKNLVPARFVLSADKPQVLYVPPGYANGFMSLTDDAKLLYFSTKSVEESQTDDYRYDSRFWDIWEVKER